MNDSKKTKTELIAELLELRQELKTYQAREAEWERTREELQQSEAVFRRVFQTIPDALTITRLSDGRYIEINDGFSEITGYQRSEVIGKTVADIHIWPDLKDRETFVHQLRQEGVLKDLELQCRYRDGSIRTVLQSASLLTLNEEECILTAGKDIQDRINAEAALRQSQARHGLAAKAGQSGVWDWDLRTDEIYVDPNLKATLGYADHEIRNHLDDWGRLVHPDDAEAVMVAATAHIEGRTPVYEIAHRMLHRDGSIRWVLARGAAQRDENGVAYRVIGTDTDITERMQAENALRYQATLLESTSDAVITTDLDFTIQSWNSAAEALYGLSAKEVIGKPMGQVMPTEYLDDRREAVLAQFQAEGVWQGEAIQRHKDDHDLYVLASVALVRDAAGRPLSILIVNRDITERMQAESQREVALEALRDSRHLLQTVLDSIPSAVFWKDRDSIYLGGNRSWLESVGLQSSEEIVGKSDYDLPWEKEQTDSFREHDRRVMESGIPEYGIIEPYLRADGAHAWAETNKVPLRDTEGNVIGVLGTYENITERVRAESQMEAALEALRESEEKFRLVTETVEDVFWMSTPGVEEMVYVSPAYERIWGRTLKSLYMSPHSFVESILPEDRDGYGKFITDFHAKGRPYSCEYRILRNDGSVGWISERGFPVEDENGKCRLMTGVCTDITERVRADEALRESEERYRSLFEGAGDHIFVVDEDLRYLMVNPGALNAGGFTLEDVVGKAPHELFPQDAEFYSSQYRQVLETGETTRFERMLAFPDDLHWFSVTLSPIKDGQGRVVAVTGISRDITERVRAEEQLLVANERMQHLLASTSAVIYTAKTSGDYGATFISENVIQMVSHEPREYLEESSFWIDHIHPEDVPRILAELPTIFEQERYAYEYRFRRKDGEYIWVRDEMKLMRDEEGQPLEIIGFWTDITERVRAREALRESEARMVSIFRAAPIGIGVVSNRVILDVNARFCEITGYSRDELIGKNARLVYPSDEVYESVGSAKYAQIEERGIGSVETCFKHKDGRIIDVLLGSAPLDLTDLSAGVTFTALDITEKVRAERALRRSLEETARGQRTLLALSQAAQTVQRASTPEAVYRIISEQTARLGFDTTILALSDDRKHLVVSHLTLKSDLVQAAEKLTGLSVQEYRFPLKPGGFFQRIIAGGETVFSYLDIAPFAEALPRPLRPLAGRLANWFGWQQSVISPLVVGDEASGVLVITGTGLVEADVPAINVFAKQASIALENARLFVTERQRRMEAESLRDASLALTSTLDLDLVLDSVLGQLGQVVTCDSSTVFLLEGEDLRLVAARGQPHPDQLIDSRFPTANILVQQIHRTRLPVILEDAQADPRFENWGGTDYVHGWMGIPLIARGEMIGYITCDSRDVAAFSKRDADLAWAFANQVASAVENARLYEQVHSGRRQLQILSRRLVETQESERRHIARELHDEIGQALTSVKIDLDGLLRLPGASELLPDLEQCINTVHRSLEQVRDLSLDLRPSLLDDLGLVPALRWYLKRQAVRVGFAARFVAEPEEMRLPPELEVTCFRVLQEALTNVARHAAARHVSVEVRRHEVALELIIRDDGAGFDVPAAMEGAVRGTSFGLLGMQERVSLVDGQIEIESVPGHGTEIRIRFPLVPPQSREA